MSNILNFLGTTLFTSVPEEYMYAFLGLFLIKLFKIYNHDYFDINNNFFKKTIRLFLISVIPTALLSDILIRLHVNEGLIAIICMLAIGISLIVYCKITQLKKAILIIPIMFLSVSIGACIDSVVYQLIFGITHTNKEYYDKSLWLKCEIIAFPRILEYAWMLLVLLKKNLFIKTDVIKTIIKSKILFIVVCMYIILNATGFVVFCQYVVAGNILSNTNAYIRTLITLGIFVLIIFDIASIFVATTLVQMKERLKYKYGKEVKI